MLIRRSNVAFADNDPCVSEERATENEPNQYNKN